MSALAISLIPIPAFVTCCTAASSKHWGEEAWVWYKAGLFAGQSFALLRVGPENGAGGVAWEWCWGCGLRMVLGVGPGNVDSLPTSFPGPGRALLPPSVVHCCFIACRAMYQQRTEPFYTPVNSVTVTESQVVRETLW